jgi:hypothetical protein
MSLSNRVIVTQTYKYSSITKSYINSFIIIPMMINMIVHSSYKKHKTILPQNPMNISYLYITRSLYDFKSGEERVTTKDKAKLNIIILILDEFAANYPAFPPHALHPRSQQVPLHLLRWGLHWLRSQSLHCM